MLADGKWDGVLHFAALSLVGESMQDPVALHDRRTRAPGYRLIEACVRHGVKKFVLSSTANLFGNPDEMPITETARIDPGSPYGESKLADRAGAALGRPGARAALRACLRYFNAAGADPDGRLGEDHDPETHLIPLTIDAALGRRPPLTRVRHRLPDPGRHRGPRLHPRDRPRPGAPAGARRGSTGAASPTTSATAPATPCRT